MRDALINSLILEFGNNFSSDHRPLAASTAKSPRSSTGIYMEGRMVFMMGVMRQSVDLAIRERMFSRSDALEGKK